MATRKKPARQAGTQRATLAGKGVNITRAVTILRPAPDLYGFWRRFENITKVVKHPVSITMTSDTESRWSVSAPGGKRVEWDAVVTDDKPNELISWRSREDAGIPNSGSVRFTPAPGGDVTEVIAELALHGCSVANRNPANR